MHKGIALRWYAGGKPGSGWDASWGGLSAEAKSACCGCGKKRTGGRVCGLKPRFYLFVVPKNVFDIKSRSL